MFRIIVNRIADTDINLLPTTAYLLTETKPESENFCNKTSAIYQGHFFVSFWYNEEPLFDIQHIISILNLRPASHIKKYDECYPFHLFFGCISYKHQSELPIEYQSELSIEHASKL